MDASRSFGLIFAQLDMEPSIEPEFNDWYDTEHIRERLAIPGFRTARRAERAAPTPRYIALYDLDSLAVLETAAYVDKQGDRRTPWTARMLRLTKKFDRRLYEQVVPGREEIGSGSSTVMWFVPHEDASRSAMEGHVERLRKSGSAARLFDGRTAAEHLVLVTTDEPGAKTVAAQCTVGRCDVYGPYQAPVHAKKMAYRTL